MSDRVILVPLAHIEGAHLARLTDEFRALLAEATPATDPSLSRLVPDAYPDDTDASAQFAEATHDDLLRRRAADAAIVRAGLERFTEPIADDDAALVPFDLVIADAELDAWLRTLTAIRLVIAERLGIESEAEHDPDDERYAVYDWLGYRLEGLINAADEHDHSAR